LAVSLQSKRIGWVTVARSAGLTKLGVPSVPGVGGGAAPGNTVRLADRVAVPRMAVMVTGVFADTGDVVTVKLAEPWPAGTVTTGWGRADRLLVESVTDTPPAGAVPFRNTVPETLLPPVTLAAASVTDARRGGAFGSGARSMNADLVTPPAVASMRTVPPMATGLVVIVKLFALFPAGMETVGGTWTSDGSALVSVTAPPAAGASITSETVPRVDVPPIRPVGLTPSARRTGAPGGPGSISRSLACIPPVVPYVA